mmetsp:Transcript_22698/g.69359  ORF Transcript_22698/g.69359 Transcript_22698/m.69359 type:complete len:324 (-) Transcript_22698:92-1063(-)
MLALCFHPCFVAGGPPASQPSMCCTRGPPICAAEAANAGPARSRYLHEETSPFLLAARSAVNSAEFSKANCALLRNRLDLSESQLRAILIAYPPVLGYSYELNIEPSLAALQSRLSLSESQLRRIVLKKPQMLGYSYEANVKPSLAKLQSRLELNESQLTSVVVGMPSVLSYSFEDKIDPAITQLQARLNIDDAALRNLVVLFPAVLGYSFQVNLLPKLNYIQHEFNFTTAELARRVQTMPALLGYSLKLRYKPRVELCRKYDVPLIAVLNRITRSDAEFSDWVAIQANSSSTAREVVRGDSECGRRQRLGTSAAHMPTRIHG